MKGLWRGFCAIYDRAWVMCYALFLSAWFGGTLIQRSEDHHGWAWAGWVLVTVAIVLMSYISALLRKSRR